MRKIISERKGESYVEMIVSVMLILILFTGLILSCIYVSKYFGCVYSVRSAVRQIEECGQAGDNIKENLNMSLCEAGLENTDIQIDAEFLEENKIQLRTPFTLSVKATYPFKLCSFGDREVNLSLPVEVSLKGRSEVYWKD